MIVSVVAEHGQPSLFRLRLEHVVHVLDLAQSRDGREAVLVARHHNGVVVESRQCLEALPHQ